jgi:hypothetical protein
MGLSELRQAARAKLTIRRGSGASVDDVTQLEDDDTITKAEERRQLVRMIAMAPLEVELSISQRGGSSCVCIQARCLCDSDGAHGDATGERRRHHGVLWQQLGLFESALTGVVEELWKGCSFAVSEGGNGIAEGVPPPSAMDEPQPAFDERLDEKQPQLEGELELEPEPERVVV